MSPRAAWRLEAAGFGPVYDYVAGKTDWLAADLPFEGTAQLAGMFTRREVATASEDTPAQEALRRLDAREFGYNTPFSQTTLESLYRNHGQYVALVAQESNRLVREGFWLRPDAQEVIKQAAQADVP